ncbi:MAG: aminopeptidase P N-terminal domain-containing protein [Candidatus Cloacimonetes bacterium]|nr:aminopeptidase P N-terminal domain-containing protein [Candidatus Cloacimonadota bacterium]
MSKFTKRQKELMNSLGDGVLVLAGASLMVRNSDVDFPFRQNSDMRYLVGFEEPDSVLILRKKSDLIESVLIVPPSDKLQEIWNGKRQGIEGAINNFNVDRAYSNKELEAALQKELEGFTTLFFEWNESDSFDQIILKTFKAFKNAYRKNPIYPTTTSSYGKSLWQMRQRKDQDEQKTLGVAAKITQSAFEHSMKNLKPNMNEAEIYALLEYEYLKNGGTSGYGNIVAGGANATCLHYTNNNAPLNAEDILLIDSGCEKDGYTADVTRCFPVNGKFGDKQAKIYSIVLEANKRAIEKCVVGSSLRAVHEEALNVLVQGLIDINVLDGSLEQNLKSMSYKKFYMHNTSHWLGMDVHDVGLYDVDGVPVPFEEGMCLTVEPGLYFNPDFSERSTDYDGIGVRIEDNIVISKSGPINLTKNIIKEISEIESMMAGSSE